MSPYLRRLRKAVLWLLAALAALAAGTLTFFAIQSHRRESRPAADAATPQDRCSALKPGTTSCADNAFIVLRNSGRKDNTFSSLDLRLSKDFAFGGVTVEPVFEVFNLLDRANFLRPETTNLAFNFDGTVRSGAGDPRIIQVGLKLLW